MPGKILEIYQQLNEADLVNDFSKRQSITLNKIKPNEVLKNFDLKHQNVENPLGLLENKLSMETYPMIVDVQLNDISYEDALVDTGNSCYITVNLEMVERLKLPKRLLNSPRRVQGVSQGMNEEITHYTWAAIDVGGYRVQKAYMYIIPNQRHKMILGLKWFEEHNVLINCEERVLIFQKGNIKVTLKNKTDVNPECVQIDSSEFMKDMFGAVQVFAASIEDIEKALSVKTPVDPREYLPEYLLPLIDAFEPMNATTLPPHCQGVDHQMPLETDENGKEKEVPWGPLYSMSRDELLVLRKTLTELLDKNWIRQSKSPYGAPVLFAKKPGSGLRFCVDYRGLDAVTKKDRYPIPLIR